MKTTLQSLKLKINNYVLFMFFQLCILPLWMLDQNKCNYSSFLSFMMMYYDSKLWMLDLQFIICGVIHLA